MWNRTILIFAVAIIGLTAATPSEARRLPKGIYVVMLTDAYGKEHRPGGISAARVPSRPNFPTSMRGSLGRWR